MVAFGASENIKVYPGATKPLIRLARHDPEIHGVDGLGGVENLPPADHPAVLNALDHPDGVVKAIDGIANAVCEQWKNGAGTQITLIATGPMTNIALFVSVYPELLAGIGECMGFCDVSINYMADFIVTEEFIFMGGGVGMGNRSSSAGRSSLA